MNKLLLPVLAAIFAAGTLIGSMLQPEAVIEVVAWSPQEIHDAGLEEHPTTGLSVVGHGEKVFLSGMDAEGAEVTAYAWTLTGPDGSVAALSSTTDQDVTFRPDLEGQYTVELTITTADGQATTSTVITAAEYVGVGTVGGQTPDFSKGQCAGCHSGNAMEWAETGHSTMFEEAIDGIKSSHYNEGCVECHTVGYNLEEEADNGGFDDVARALGWTFPDTLVDGNWQDIVDNYPDLADVSNIQCENCHGPGSQHFGDKTKIALSIDEGVCGRCHEEEPYHVKNIQWKSSGHATGSSFARGTSSSCAPCHSGWGFIARMDPASNLEKTSGTEPVTCAVCHDPHSDENAAQLRAALPVDLVDGTVVNVGGNGAICMQCHKARREKAAYLESNPATFRGAHHSIQTEMLFGTNMWTFGFGLSNSTHKDVVEDLCVTCHMANSEFDELGEHSWGMHAEVETDAGTAEVDLVTACIECHDPTMTSFDDMMARADYDGDGEVEAAQEEVSGLLHNVAMMLPPYGEDEVDIRDTTLTQLQKKALWNFLASEEDGSHGVHNYQFTVGLLQLTEAALKYGVLDAGSIASVLDVPNDQGKQVFVTWERFGGDGVSDTPLQTYYVWRKVHDAGEMVPTYGSLRNIPTETLAKTGATLAFAGDLWTAVASQPAAAMDMYTAVAPTLYDSTADGMMYSYFMVSGHAANSQDYVVSVPDSGYSVDNLAPQAPSNVAAAAGRAWVNVTWDDPVDADFDYFAVYRSTEQGFDPTGMDPIRNVTSPRFDDIEIAAGTTYYYRVSAFDFNGNESEYSPEAIEAVVTGTEAMGEVPEFFAVHQNYPNPFNPSTVIAYDVPETAKITLAVYDLVGRPVRVLVDREVPAGRHSTTLDASNLSSGIYLVLMDTPEGVFERSIMLLK